MKKIVTLLFILFFVSVTKGQYVNIPDSNFRNYLKTRYPSCFNVAGQMDTTCSAILAEDTITIPVYSAGYYSRSVEGIKYFKGLKYFDCSNSWIASIPVLPVSLKVLKCFNLFNFNTPISELPPQLEYLNLGMARMSGQTLPQLPSTLRYLDINETGLSVFPLLPDSLEYLDFNFNYFRTIPSPLPSNLKVLDCSSNDSIQLPALPNGLLKLKCYYNHHTSLPSLPSSLTFIDCRGNSLTTLPPLPSHLDTLICEMNQITNLPDLPGSLKSLVCGRNLFDSFSNVILPEGLLNFDCSSNNLVNLPNLPSSLVTLNCNVNQILHLPKLPDSLKTLQCYFNQLMSLPELPSFIEELDCRGNNIYCLPKIPEYDRSVHERTTSLIVFDGDKISCLPNAPLNVTFTSYINGAWIYSFPLCNPTNNNNHCSALPVISGKAYVDNNQNGIKDSNEPWKSNIKVSLDNGHNIVFSDANGYFEVSADSLGSHSVDVTAPYFNIIPSTAAYSFSTYDTIVSKEYALQANTIKDSLAIKLTPLNWAARPGFSFPYTISYENAGTTTLSPNIVFNYDDTRLIYDSSSNTAVVNNGNNLSLSVGSFVPGQHENFTVFFRVSPTVIIGDSLFAKATINDNTTVASDSSKVFVRGSFDPNDKQATPELSPLQVLNGAYINYTIRFQNTGNDTAFDVVISDTLAQQLLLNTLEVTACSHTCKTTVKGNIVFFEFLDIQLPDSNMNEIKSHGFVSFRIKPHPSVPSGENIDNKAAIYFDYNAPVITNTARTYIKPFTIIPLKLISFSAIPQNDKTSLHWNTENEINTKQFIIERGSDGIHFNSITSINAKRNMSNSYSSVVADAGITLAFYRLKIIDADGSYTYSPVIKTDRRKSGTGINVLSNPVKEILLINTTDRNLHNTQASIINMQGAVVKTFMVKEGNEAVEIKDLPTGIYYLRTINGSQKILLQ